MPATSRKRLDLLLVESGKVSSREKAKALIMSGRVFVNEKMVDKPGTSVSSNASVTIKGRESPFVSRGGLKLEKAVNVFMPPVEGRVYIDVGASTGGFTHCLLNHGARHVVAIDVGYGQLAWELRQDPRVTVMERTNIRYVNREALPNIPEGAVIDVSFISLKLVLPVVYELLKEDSHVIALVKPQFEAGKGRVGKKGVVRDPLTHREVLTEILLFSKVRGFDLLGLDYSPITGPEGNIEFLVHLYKGNATFEEEKKEFSSTISDQNRKNTYLSEQQMKLIYSTVEKAHRELKKQVKA